MHKILMSFIALLFAISGFAQSYTVGSFNLRYANPNDKGNLWSEREPLVVSLIRFHDFDILGTQEGLQEMITDMSRDLPQYGRYGIGRDDGKDKGEHTAIFYKKDKFEVKDSGDFWLSETPEKPSMGWNSTCCNRVLSWVNLQDKSTGKRFFVFNTHYSLKSLAREESSKLVLKRIKAIAGENPVIFMGDLNSSEESREYQLLENSGILKDTYYEVKHPYANNPSYHDFGKRLDESDIIDHIFVSRDFEVKRWGLLTDSFHGKFPSDHFPVLVKLLLS